MFAIINDNLVFVSKLQNMNVGNMRFQQDGAIYYIIRETIQLLHESFPDHVILVIRIEHLDRAI